MAFSALESFAKLRTCGRGNPGCASLPSRRQIALAFEGRTHTTGRSE
jgi:hypothetical protein